MPFDFEDYIKENFDHKVQASNHDQILINCINPDCSDNWRRRKKMTVNIADKQAFCFICGASYTNAVDFVAAAENISRLEAVRIVKADAAIRVPHGPSRLQAAIEKFTGTGDEAEVEALPPSSTLAIPELEKISPGSRPHNYLTGRRFDDKVIEHFRLAYVGDFLSQYHDRIFIPVYLDGVMNGFQCRAIKNVKPKYLFPTEGGFQNSLYNWDDAKYFGTIIIVEGVTDCWRLWSKGFHNVVASFGKTLKQEQRKMILGEDRIKTVILFWDGEGLENAYGKVIKELMGHKQLRIVELPEDMEPDTCPDPGDYISRAIDPTKLTPLQRKLRGHRW